MLKEKIFSQERVITGEEIFSRFRAFDFAKAKSRKDIKLEDLDIKEEEKEMYAKLPPITNASPYIVLEMIFTFCKKNIGKVVILFQ